MALPAGYVLQEPPLGVEDFYFNHDAETSISVESGLMSEHPIGSARPEYVVGDVVVDGATFQMSEIIDADGGRQIAAAGVVGDSWWLFSILGRPDEVDQDLAREILATFRLAPSGFAPLVCAGGYAALSLTGTESLTKHCQVSDGRYSVTWEADGSCLFKVRFFDGSSTDVTVVSATVSGETKRGTATSSSLPSDNYYLFVEADGCNWTAIITGER